MSMDYSEEIGGNMYMAGRGRGERRGRTIECARRGRKRAKKWILRGRRQLLSSSAFKACRFWNWERARQLAGEVPARWHGMSLR
jgi:hypothetical protein